MESGKLYLVLHPLVNCLLLLYNIFVIIRLDIKIFYLLLVLNTLSYIRYFLIISIILIGNRSTEKKSKMFILIEKCCKEIYYYIINGVFWTIVIILPHIPYFAYFVYPRDSYIVILISIYPLIKLYLLATYLCFRSQLQRELTSIVSE